MTAILNAGIEAQVTLKTPNAVGTVAVDLTGDVGTFTLTIDPAGVYIVRAWLSDDTGKTLTATTPDVSGVRDWRDVLTDANGKYVFTVEHTGAHSWYFCWAVLASVASTAAATEWTV